MKAALLLLAACSSSSNSDDVRGPFTGPVHRFVVDRISVPSTNEETVAYAGDLDGNGTAENKLGLVMASLASTGDLSKDGPSMIASGALASVVEIQADDLANDDSVGVRYDGGEVAGARIVDGVLRTNRAATTEVPGRALVRLPIFTNAPPMELPVVGLEIDLDPAGNAIVRGGVDQGTARLIAFAGLVQMFEQEPERHLVFQRQVDTDRDGTMSADELLDSVIALLVTADIQLFDDERYAPNPDATNKDSLSVGFAVHLTPCPEGRCSTAVPETPCRDRIVDGDETDIDCGGSCQKCWDAKACSAPTDCFSNACVAGKCAVSTCTDGVRDAYESDIDCGSTCTPCVAGKVCAANRDCASGNCDNGAASTGVCR